MARLAALAAALAICVGCGFQTSGPPSRTYSEAVVIYEAEQAELERLQVTPVDPYVYPEYEEALNELRVAEENLMAIRHESEIVRGKKLNAAIDNLLHDPAFSEAEKNMMSARAKIQAEYQHDSLETDYPKQRKAVRLALAKIRAAYPHDYIFPEEKKAVNLALAKIQAVKDRCLDEKWGRIEAQATRVERARAVKLAAEKARR